MNAEMNTDEDGNKSLGKTFVKATSSSLVVNTESADHLLVVAGLSDVVVVNTPSATVVCRKDDLQTIKSFAPEVCELAEHC